MLLTISDYINTDTLLSRFVLYVFLPLKPKTLVPIKANTVAENPGDSNSEGKQERFRVSGGSSFRERLNIQFAMLIN